MIKGIKTYDELLTRKTELETLAHAQLELVKADIEDIKVEFKPVVAVFSLFNKAFTKDKTIGFVNLGINSIIDIVFRKNVLKRTGLISRNLIPFFMKNLTSHFVANHKDDIIGKIYSWLSHKKNGQQQKEAVIHEKEEED